MRKILLIEATVVAAIVACEPQTKNYAEKECKDMLMSRIGSAECPHPKHILVFEVGQLVNNHGEFTKINSVPVCRCR